MYTMGFPKDVHVHVYKSGILVKASYVHSLCMFTISKGSKCMPVASATVTLHTIVVQRTPEYMYVHVHVHMYYMYKFVLDVSDRVIRCMYLGLHVAISCHAVPAFTKCSRRSLESSQIMRSQVVARNEGQCTLEYMCLSFYLHRDALLHARSQCAIVDDQHNDTNLFQNFQVSHKWFQYNIHTILLDNRSYDGSKKLYRSQLRSQIRARGSKTFLHVLSAH